MSETAAQRRSRLRRPSGVVRVIEIFNKKGLHARASAKFVQTVEQFDADVRSPAAAKPSAAPRSWD